MQRAAHDKLNIQLLGDFRIALGGQSMGSLNSPRLQALVAYLLLHRGRPQFRQHIAFLFWPDSSEAQALSNLRKLLVTLGRTLPDWHAYISVDRHTIEWRTQSSPGAPYFLDVSDFESAVAAASATTTFSEDLDHIRALRTAVDLYTGDLLPGCYEEWIIQPREQLRQAYLEMLDALVSALELRNEVGSAILYARRLLRYDPFQEEHYRRLMRLHMANGDGAAALSVYRSCETLLRRELGAEPGQATRELAREIEQNFGREARRKEVRTHSGAQPHGRKPATAGDEAGRPIRNNIPAPTTIFIGREREVSRVSEMLTATGTRLLTITGTPGTGKTRLALQVAEGFAAAMPGAQLTHARLFEDGIFVVSLAPVDDPKSVAPTIARALAIAERSDRTALEALVEYLSDKRVLLVLDNLEHVLSAASQVAHLLGSCPNVKVLVTSRALLNISGEHEYPLPPMSVPGRDTVTLSDELLQYESVALFLQRAWEVMPGFAIVRGNARTIAEICRRLEGLPLAIELAAARVRVLSPEAILSRLDRRLKLLVGGKTDMPRHQRTLETAIAWSYNLLDQQEQDLFRKLAVFSDGCTLEAAEAVSDSPDVLDGIAALVSKSLLVRQDGGLFEGAHRFTMPETIKEYALDRLREQGEAEDLERKHALYFVALAEEAGGELDGPHQHEWTDRLDSEHENMRAALSWAIARDNADVALRLSSNLGLFWERRGYLSEGRQWIRSTLALPSSAGSPYRAEALHYGGLLASRQRDYSEAASLLQQSRLAFQELGDMAGESNALSALAIMTSDRDLQAGIDLHLESLQLRRKLGDKVGIARTLQNLGYVKMHQEAWDEAAQFADEALALYHELGSRHGIAYTLYVLAMIADKRGDQRVASARFAECLEICQELRNNWLTAWVLGALCGMYYRAGCYDDANRALAQAWDLFSEMGDKLGMAHTLVARGREAQRCKDYTGAGQLYRSALALGRELENNAVVGNCIAGFAGMASAAGRYHDAAMLFGLAERLLNDFKTSIEREQMTLGLAEAQSALGGAAWRAASAEGEALTMQDALTLTGDL